MENNYCTPIYTECMQQMKGIQDAMAVLTGKWKIHIIAAVSFTPQRFTDLQLIIEGIGTKMLSKELHDLEINGLIKKETIEDKTIVTRYQVTPYGSTLRTVIQELATWGNEHRRMIMGNKLEKGQ